MNSAHNMANISSMSANFHYFQSDKDFVQNTGTSNRAQKDFVNLNNAEIDIILRDHYESSKLDYLRGDDFKKLMYHIWNIPVGKLILKRHE